MPLVVQKYGGTSVGTPKRIQSVARRLVETQRQGCQVVAVISAMAGVTDNLEVVQAQESVAGAHESYISSLYAHNLAKVELARAIGNAEQGVKQYLQKNSTKVQP